MGKRKGRSEISETLISGGEVDDEIVGKDDKAGFFACYLLASLSPRHKRCTYIGFTVNPRRRIRQHNGEIGCGAWRTKSKRPWEMILCIYGFPTNVSALQFEWAWQHPTKSVAVRDAAEAFKSFTGIANKIKLAYTMLTLPEWQSLNLKVNFFSTKYMNISAGCPKLPEHMKVQVCSMDDLPCYTGSDYNAYENDDDWDKDEECDGTSGSYGSTGEITGEKICNYADSQKRSEDANEQSAWIEETSMGQARNLLISKEDHTQLVCPNNSLVQASSSFVACGCSVLETVEDENILKLVENRIIEVNQPARKCLPMIASANKDHQPPIKTANKDHLPTMKCLAVPNEVEVIDLLSISPGYRNKSCSKRRRSSTSCPETIDLTNSPIFV